MIKLQFYDFSLVDVIDLYRSAESLCISTRIFVKSSNSSNFNAQIDGDTLHTALMYQFSRVCLSMLMLVWLPGLE